MTPFDEPMPAEPGGPVKTYGAATAYEPDTDAPVKFYARCVAPIVSELYAMRRPVRYARTLAAAIARAWRERKVLWP